MPTTASHPKFDKFSFVRYMKDIGRAYRKQATELVSICRLFAQAQEQTPTCYADLRQYGPSIIFSFSILMTFDSVLDLVDRALESVAKARTEKSSKDADDNIKLAINALSDHHTKYHLTHTGTNVREQMEEAKKNDQTSSTRLNQLKEAFHVSEELVSFTPPVLNQLLIPIISQSSHSRRLRWSFLSTSRFLINVPPG